MEGVAEKDKTIREIETKNSELGDKIDQLTTERNPESSEHEDEIIRSLFSYKDEAELDHILD